MAEHDENQKRSLVRLTNFAGSAWWKLGLFTKYTVAPILDKFPSWSFRLLAYWIILTYLMEFYHGPGVLFPLFLFFAIVLCTHLLGYKRLHLKWEESIVNACCGIIVPIYVDIFSMVRYPKYISYHQVQGFIDAKSLPLLCTSNFCISCRKMKSFKKGTLQNHLKGNILS